MFLHPSLGAVSFLLFERKAPFIYALLLLHCSGVSVFCLHSVRRSGRYFDILLWVFRLFVSIAEGPLRKRRSRLLSFLSS